MTPPNETQPHNLDLTEAAAQRTSTITAQLLGFSGLLPIAAIFFSALIWPQYLTKLSLLANLYAGTIFSFLGGIQWGLSISPQAQVRISKRLLVSIAPSLWTVLALQLPAAQASWSLVAGLNALLFFELTDAEKSQRPPWYIPLRINLTLCLSLGLLAIGALHFNHHI